MEKLSSSLQNDGRILEEQFMAADQLITAGELNYRDFSSPLVRRVIYLQFALSKDEVAERYENEKVTEEEIRIV